MNEKKTKTITIYAEEALVNKAKLFARQGGMSLSTYIRLLLIKDLEKKEKKMI